MRESSQRHIEREIASLAGQLIQAGSGWQQVPLMEARSSPHTRSPSQQFAALSEAHLSSAEDILLQVVQRAKDLLGFSGGAILTVRGELAASEGLSEGLVWRLSSGEDPLGVRERLLEQEAPRVYEAGREAWLSALWECGFALVAAVPLRLSIGEASLLVLGSARLPAGYAREEALLEHLGLLQSQVVVALEHRALHWRTRRNARRLEAVGRALQRLNRVERPGDTIQTTCDQVRYIFDGSAVWVGLYERGEGGELVGLRPAVCVSGQEALLEALETRADTMAGGLYEESLRLGGIMQRATSVAWLVRPEVLAQACEQSHHPLRRLLVQETMGETLLVPIWSGVERAGVLALHRGSASELAREDYTVLRIFADQIGLSLWTTALLGEAQRRAARLEESESVYRSFLQQISDGVFRLNRNGIFEELSDFTQDLFGLSRGSLLGASLVERCAAQDRGRAREALREALGGLSQELTLNLHREDGQPRVVVVRMGPLIQGDRVVGVIGVARDDTRRRALQSRLLVREKLASVGSLAEGVAHEINNPLSFIISNLNSLRDDLKSEDDGIFEPQERLSMLTESLEGAARIRDIVRRVRQYSQQRTDGEMYEESVNHLLDDALWMVHPEARYKALLVPELGEELPAIKCSPGRLLQVFVNLLLNAIQAVRGEPRERQMIRVSSSRHPAGALVVEISDEGCGIDRDVLRLVTEPFYTTREAEGSGLGLSMSLEVIEQHGGQLRIATALGVGTRVQVRLPVSPEEGALHPSLVLEYGGVARGAGRA